MTVLFIIMGVLMVIAGFSCLFTPLATFLNMEYFIIILTVAFGIVGIIKAIASKRFKANFVFSILSVLLGIFLLVYPNFFEVTETVLLIISAIWFVIMGVITIINAIRYTKKIGSGMWVLQLIFGILAVLLGIYAVFNPILMALSYGMMVGFFFIETGFTLIFTGSVIED